MKESNHPTSYSEWRYEPNIPYRIRCTFNSDDGPLAGGIELSRRSPAVTLLTPDLPGPGRSLSMFFHYSIPPQYLEIVYFHEKVEAAAMYGEPRLSQPEAHALAVQATNDYVLRTLGKNGLNQFNRWSNSLLSQ